MVNSLAAEFDELCRSRHAGVGQEQYGNFKFLNNDRLWEDILEELADASNYLRYMYIRIRMVQEAALASRTDSTPFVGTAEHKNRTGVGASSFIPQEVRRSDPK